MIVDALIFIGLFYGLTELIIQVWIIWTRRPMVGRDPTTGRYRSVRRMAAERRR